MARQNHERITFESESFPGLEITIDNDFAIFTYWETREVFLMEEGTARLVASTDVPWVKPELYNHVRMLAARYAESYYALAELVA